MDWLVSAIGLLSKPARMEYGQVTWNDILPLDNLMKSTSAIRI